MVLGIVLALFLIAAGCITSQQNPNQNPPGNNPPANTMQWLAYAPVQAATNPWQVADIAFVNTPTELERVHAWLSSAGVEFSEAIFVPHDEVVCAALNCPRGDYLLVNPTTNTGQTKLLDMGFFPMAQPFVYVNEFSENGSYTIQLVNPTREDVYYGGCNDYTVRKITNEGPVAQPGKVCVWEGIPSVLSAGKTISFDAQQGQNGTYQIALGYGIGCTPNQPLSQSSCAGEFTLFSNTFVISNVEVGNTISMTYDLKQCFSNPWQSDTNELILTDDKINFEKWLLSNGISPLHISYVPAPEGLAVCLSCACSSGETYRIVILSNDQLAATALGFSFEGNYAWPTSPPAFSAAEWRVFTPYQCFANKWNTKKESVRNIEKDFSLMQSWLEENGVDVTYLGFIRGISLSQQCTKVSTDKYGVGVTDDESATILAGLGFVVAGPNQTKLFTETNDVTEKNYLFKTKFCEAQPWGVDLSNGNEAEVVERVMQWLADAGIPSYEKPTIHKVGVSVTGSCGTDSGLGVYVTVPAWAETHITPYGFAKPSYAFNPEKSQVFPVISPSSGNEGGTMIAGGEDCVGDACAYT